MPGGWTSYFTEVADRAPVGETCGTTAFSARHVDIDGIYAERTGDPDGLRAYCEPGWGSGNYGPIYYFPRESIRQVVGQLCEDGDDFPVLFDGERVIEAFDGTPVHMSSASRSTARRCGPAATTSAGARPSRPISAFAGGTSDATVAARLRRAERESI